MIDNILTLLKSPHGQLFLYFFVGFGIASLFRKSCSDEFDECIKYVAPDVNTVKNNTYIYHGTCYTFQPYSTECKDITTITHA